MEKDLLFGVKQIGSSHVGSWGNEILSPGSAQPCFPQIGKGMQKGLCPFREGWRIKWWKSNG